MEFKDKIIEKLQNELDECIKYRRRTGQRNLELVSATLGNLIYISYTITFNRSVYAIIHRKGYLISTGFLQTG